MPDSIDSTGGRAGRSSEPASLSLFPVRAPGRGLLCRGVLSVVAGAVMFSGHGEVDAPHVLMAYIDPGSGALALQLVASVFVGLLFYVKRLRLFVARTWARLWDRKRG